MIFAKFGSFYVRHIFFVKCVGKKTNYRLELDIPILLLLQLTSTHFIVEKQMALKTFKDLDLIIDY